MVEQCNDKWLAIVPGIFLNIQHLIQLLFRYCPGADQDLPDPHPVIEVVGTDKISIMEHQLTLPLFTGESQYT